MGFMDELKRLSQPFDDDDDFYEDAVIDENPKQQRQSNQSQDNVKNNKSASEQFEDSFGNDYSEPEPVRKKAAKQKKVTSGAAGSIFGNLGNSNETPQKKRSPVQQDVPRQQQRSSRRANNVPEQQVVLFNPKDFDEAGELVTYILQGRSLVMALEGIPMDTARRLLDFISGICFALNAKITPVSAKTYFITPENVDLLDAQALQKNETSGQDDF